MTVGGLLKFLVFGSSKRLVVHQGFAEPFGGARQAAFTQVFWMWDVGKSAESQFWMDLWVLYPSNDFVTAPSP